MLKNLYARVVLWLIRPALELRHEQQRFDPAAFAAEVERLNDPIDPSLVAAIRGSSPSRPM